MARPTWSAEICPVGSKLLKYIFYSLLTRHRMKKVVYCMTYRHRKRWTFGYITVLWHPRSGFVFVFNRVGPLYFLYTVYWRFCLTRLFSLISSSDSLENLIFFRDRLFLIFPSSAGRFGAFLVGTAFFLRVKCDLIPNPDFSLYWTSWQSSVKWALHIKLHFDNLKSDLVVSTNLNQCFWMCSFLGNSQKLKSGFLFEFLVHPPTTQVFTIFLQGAINKTIFGNFLITSAKITHAAQRTVSR